jgi:calcium homeostasis ER protein
MFASAAAMPPSLADQQRLDMSNKGHQMMKNMGWSGASGLGKQEQGIFNPIEGGQARDKSDMFKGVGARNDPFEAFRKNKSQGYIQRLRTRDEIRESK